MYYVVGLGNPGEEYAHTRHNVGRIVVVHFLHANGFPVLVASAKYAGYIAEGMLEDEKVFVLQPETYMNKSGSAVAKVITNSKKARNLVVIYDDIDLPLGTIKISYGRGSGGHRGVESIIRTLKTKDFARIRVGIAPTTSSGKLRKPKGEQKVIDFLLSDFKKPEQAIIRKTAKQVSDIIETIVTESLAAAMNRFN